MLHKQLCEIINKYNYIKLLRSQESLRDDVTYGQFQQPLSIRRIVYPSGKPMIPHLPAGTGSYDLRCQGFGVDDYSLTL
jgi:hypothetical protein